MKNGKLRTFYQKHENRILAAVLILALLLLAGVCFDYYYDLNDDLLMKDILSGRYTGSPAGHNIQMHYPLSFCISLLYRLAPALPWYGLFLCLCQYGCLYLITERSLKFCRCTSSKLLLLLLEGVLTVLLLLRHLVYVQYTVTSALCAIAALVWFATSQTGRERLSVRAYLIANVPAALLCLLSFCLRSEMFLLMSPFVGLTGVLAWSMEKKIFTGENFRRYLGVLGMILAGLGVCQLIHTAGYASEEWRDFYEFFDARTQVYDFQEVPSFEENTAFYESLGLKQSQQQLFVNYNFGLDEDIDAALMRQVSAYEAQLEDREAVFGQLQKSLWNYRYRLFHNADEPALEGLQDMPYNMAVLCLYVLVLFAALAVKKYRVLWQLPLLFAARSVVWLFILIGNRDPIRITHPLYLIELAVLSLLLGWYLGTEGKWSGRTKKMLAVSLAVCVCVKCAFLFQSGGIGGFWREVTAAVTEAQTREEKNEGYAAMLAECRSRPEQFYFADVYSTVDFSEKMFAEVDNSLLNYDLMGGWCSKSPLYREKLAQFGLPSMEEALLLPQVRLLKETGADTDWLVRYYADQGIAVRVAKEKSLSGGMEVCRVSLN